MMSETFVDELILVDPEDNVLGYKEKMACHVGEGTLHRAFSIFIFDSRGRLLLQKRSALKPLWPLYWSNSVCSHPRKGENDMEAAHRRLQEEVGMKTELTYLFKFQYQAPFKDKGSENELCSVFVGHSDGPVKVNPDEIAEWRFISPEELTADVKKNPELYTPWFKMEWERILRDHAACFKP